MNFLKLVDDIIDTGLTLSKLATELAAFVGDQGRVWTALLVSKRTPLRRPDACHGDFVAFSIPDKCVPFGQKGIQSNLHY